MRKRNAKICLLAVLTGSFLPLIGCLNANTLRRLLLEVAAESVAAPLGDLVGGFLPGNDTGG